MQGMLQAQQGTVQDPVRMSAMVQVQVQVHGQHPQEKQQHGIAATDASSSVQWDAAGLEGVLEAVSCRVLALRCAVQVLLRGMVGHRCSRI